MLSRRRTRGTCSTSTRYSLGVDAVGVDHLKPGETLEDCSLALAAKKIASVFHQVTLAEKRAGLSSIYSALSPGCEPHVAEPNADGVPPSLMKEAGFAQVKETSVIPTLTGSMSLYPAIRPAT